MADSIEITFTPGCHGTQRCGEVVTLIRAVAGIRKVFHSSKGQGAESCCATLTGLGKSDDILAAIKNIEGVDTVRAQIGYGYIKPAMESSPIY